MEQLEKKVKIIWYTRICLWIVALIGCLYWIVWSFKLYNMGIHDVHEYTAIFRPIFAKGLLVSLVSIVICFGLRSISDKCKAQIKKMKFEEMQI